MLKVFSFSIDAVGARAVTLMKGVSIAALLVPAPFMSTAMAETADTPGLEEIVVTARRREESLMRVPVSVAALTPNSLGAYNLDNMSKIGEAIPHVQLIKAASGSGAILSIRGVGSAPIDSGIAQSVGVVIDGAQVSQGNIVLLGFFDQQQVEVMKGPQALFFGKNSPAGVVSFTSKGPGDTFESYGKAGYEFDGNERKVEGAVGGPLTDELGARVAVQYRKMNGYLDNRVGTSIDPILGVPLPAAPSPRSPEQEEFSTRISAKWAPSDAFTAQLKLLYSHKEDNGDAFQITTICAPGQTTPTTLGMPDPFARCFDGNRSSIGNYASMPAIMATGLRHSRDGVNSSELDAFLGTVRLDYEFSNLMLTSLTSYVDYDYQPFGNFTGGTFPYFAGVNDEAFNSATEEVRLSSKLDGRVNFMVGGLYEETTVETYGDRYIGPFGPDPVTGNWFALSSPAQVDGKTYSAFAQVTYGILENLEASVGARYSKDERDLVKIGNTYVHSGAPFLLPAGTFLSGSTESTNVSPEFTLTYRPTGEAMVYGAYKTGYKPGSFGLANVLSLALAARGADGLKFRKEEAEGFEIGAKGEFFGNSLRLQTTVYRYEFTDLQTVAFDGATINYTYSNAGKSRTEGIDVEADWIATDKLTIHAAGGYNKARFVSFTDAQCFTGQTLVQGCRVVDPVTGRTGQDLSGVRLPHASDWAGTFGFSYDQPIMSGYHAVLYADANYLSAYNASEMNLQGGQVDAITRVNFGTRIGPDDDAWRLALFARNIGNEIAPLSVNEKPGGGLHEAYATSFDRGRELWMELSARF